MLGVHEDVAEPAKGSVVGDEPSESDLGSVRRVETNHQ